MIGGTFYVNKLAASATINQEPVTCGQTAVFPGGPGYADIRSIPLTLSSTSIAALGGETITTYLFDKATVMSSVAIIPRVETGVCALTYSGSPSQIFANQRLVGFYRDQAWGTCLGVPIYDYGSFNASLTTTAVPQAEPELIYGDTVEFLNGGSLQNVLQKLLRANYMLSSDRLVSILEDATQVGQTANGVGLSVTTAALEFTMSSSGRSPLVNQLSLPVLATVTTTPGRILIPVEGPLEGDVALRSVQATVGGSLTASNILQPIGGNANNPSPAQLSPKTTQIPLTATVPQVVLAATGVTSLEIGTAFPEQHVGAGAGFESESAGTVLNLTSTGTPALAPLSVVLSSTGITFTSGVTYTFSVAGNQLTVSGSDGSSSTAVLPEGANVDATHTFVGMAVYTATTTSVALYPLLPLSFPAPAVGTNGVAQGSTYSIRLTYGASTSEYEITDANQSVVSGTVSLPSPTPSEGSTPQPGDQYFGTFTGGAAAVTVWSIPVFLPVKPSQVAAAGFNGAITLVAQVSGLPAYDLSITDSSLFVYSNINIDTATAGSVAASNVYLASAVVNSAPDDDSPRAFAPCRLLMGIIRQVQMVGTLRYAFIPEDDSVVIGGIRYVVSIINLAEMGEDPNALPYPPSYWPDSRFWQFANRHNPFRAVRYAGATEADRLLRAAHDVEIIGTETRRAQEPMQLYLDTNSSEMTVWPIYAFPYATSTQSVDQGQLKLLGSSIIDLLATSFPPELTLTASELGEQIQVPSAMRQNNPYTYGVTSVDAAGGSPIVLDVVAPTEVDGKVVTNLSPSRVAASGAATLERGAVAAIEERGAGQGRGAEPYRSHWCQPRHRGAAPPAHLWVLGVQPGHGRGIPRRDRQRRSGHPRPIAVPHDEQDLRPVLRAGRIPQSADVVQHVDHRALDGARPLQLPGSAGDEVHERSEQDRRPPSRLHVPASRCRWGVRHARLLSERYRPVGGRHDKSVYEPPVPAARRHTGRSQDVVPLQASQLECRVPPDGGQPSCGYGRVRGLRSG